MPHHHHHEHIPTRESRLWLTMLLNFAITAAELAGGLISGSLSLLSDAVHNLSDGVAIIIGIAAMRLSRRPQTLRHTFGMKRAEILAAVINSATLILLGGFLIREALGRLQNPPAVGGHIMLVTASIGLLANVAGTLLLRRGAAGSLNVRAAYFHLLSDAVSSLAVILGAVVMLLWDAAWVDPVLTILLSLYIVMEALKILWEAVEIMMMFTPPGLDLMAIKESLEKNPGVKQVHHVHAWRLNDQDLHFEAHVDVEDMKVSETAGLLEAISHELKEHFGISHITIQFECGVCTRTGLLEHESAIDHDG